MKDGRGREVQLARERHHNFSPKMHHVDAERFI